VTAFAGVRVLDCSTSRSGAMAAMHLGDLGADVVRVDDRDDERGRDEPGYLAWDRNKTRVVLDPDDTDDLVELRRLVGECDVVIFDSSPDELARRGLDGPTLTREHERLIHAWAPPFGERGRWSSLPASHHLLAGLTGIGFEQGSYADVPVHLVSPQAHYGQANMLALAIGAALLERDRSGHGQTVVVSGLHGAAQVMIATRWERSTGTIWRAPLGGAPNYRLYQCADDEWLFLGALFEPVYLRALEVTGVLVEVLSEPEIDGDLRAALVAPGATITKRLLEDAFRRRMRAEWLRVLESADVPCGPVRARAEWFHHETVAANEMRIELEHPVLGTVEMPGVSLRLSESSTVAPRLTTPATDPSTPWRDRSGALTPDEAKPESTRAPLAGVRVLDLGVVIAGAYAGSILASLGADVVKVEAPHGDPFRSYGSAFAHYNRGKRSLVLDLKRPEDRTALLDLARDADVVLDNFRLGVRERLAIAYEDLHAVNPRIISCSISGYGTQGPQASQPGFDPLLQAQSGLMQAQGGAGSEPVFHGIPVNDVGSAAIAALGIVAALHARSRTGEGQEVRTSLAAQSVLLQSGEVTSHATAPPPTTGGRDFTGTSAFERYYECTDGWVAIACTTSAQRAALANALDLDAGLDDAATPRLAATFATLAVDTALTRLEEAGVPAAPALRLEQTYDDPFFVENEHYAAFVDDEYGPAIGCPRLARFGRTDSGFLGGAPRLGDDRAALGVPSGHRD
jgi:crotonobetainyl-CoA:carnitine CoA-transferase CaiB-like acyl-CoA transferase